MNNLWILAQTDSNDAPQRIVSGQGTSESQGEATATVQSDSDAPAPRPKPFFQNSQFIFLGLMLVVMYLFIFRGPRKKQQQHRQMMQALGKNDRVQTIGGIIGTVVDIKDDEITLKIDESNNTKMKILRSAISRNVTKDKS
jgi:preprotein translocase subunit YajC